MKIEKKSDVMFVVEKEGNMRVPVKVFANDLIFEKLKEDRCLQQGINVATLPGILGWSVMMPDAHQGYGFSIGGVAAMDAENGVLSPGGVGFDVNCGVRLLTTNLEMEEVKEKIRPLLDALFAAVPTGVGCSSQIKLTHDALDEVLVDGAQWAVKKGYGVEDDFVHCESEGKIPNAVSGLVSPRAKKRGKDQLGTLGAGNHFLEIQVVDEIVDEEKAKVFGISHKGQVVVMIHCGSRGLGHQVCSDFIRKIEEAYPDIVAGLPDKDLVYAPIGSRVATEYFGAMCAAANFAFANRHIIGHWTRGVFKDFFPESELRTVYDVAHNIAKLEEHEIEGVKRKVYVHRKGATRAFGPGSEGLPADYTAVGQPIILPGSMGTASWLLVGTETSMAQSYGSTAHGAGRVMSRSAAKRLFKGEEVKAELEKKGIIVKAASWKGICEEAPGVYKDVDAVVEVSHKAGIGKKVARLRPLGVIKG
ncbi:RNA-splicing ligase RtcB [Candidatus Woesearchaeota archaeon]|nr:RNA-splicing ligase RtcB [Candidatus Woesearchaeota archaeon]